MDSKIGEIERLKREMIARNNIIDHLNEEIEKRDKEIEFFKTVILAILDIKKGE